MKRAAQDEPRHRVDVRRHRLAPEPHRFQRNRPAPRERVEHPRGPSPERLPDLLPEPRKLPAVLAPPVEDPAPSLLLHPLAAGARRFDHPPRHPLQQLPTRVPAARIRQQRRQQRRPTRRQRPPRRPDVQRRDVPVPDVLLVDGVEGDLLQRESCLDEAFVSHPGWIPATCLSIKWQKSRCMISPALLPPYRFGVTLVRWRPHHRRVSMEKYSPQAILPSISISIFAYLRGVPGPHGSRATSLEWMRGSIANALNSNHHMNSRELWSLSPVGS